MYIVPATLIVHPASTVVSKLAGKLVLKYATHFSPTELPEVDSKPVTRSARSHVLEKISHLYVQGLH